MAITITSIINAVKAVPTVISTAGTIRDAYKEVKDVQENPSKLEPWIVGKEIKSLTTKDLNALKKKVVTDVLRGILLSKLEKRGCGEKDLSVIINFAVVVYKLIRGKV